MGVPAPEQNCDSNGTSHREQEEAEPCTRHPHEPHPSHKGSRQPEAYLDVMSLRDNNILMGKQVLYTILGNDVLNLQTQRFRPKKEVTTAHLPHRSRAGSCLSSVPVSTPPLPTAPSSPHSHCTESFGSWDVAPPVTWLSEVTKCCTVCPSAVVISWMYVASSCRSARAQRCQWGWA